MAEKTTAKKSIFENPLLSTKIKSANVSLFPETAIGYLIGPMLALISNGVVNTYLMQYWDKVLKLGEWGLVFETILPIVSAIIIIIGNLLVGKLMERKPTMAGKARPLILLGLPFVAVALLVLFLVPLPEGAGGTSSNILASIMIAIGYNLYYAIAWPIYYTSHSALVNLSTRDNGARGLLSTAVMAAQLGAAGLAGMIGPFLVDAIGLLPTYDDAGNYVISPADANGKWTILMVVMIICLVVGCLLEFYFTRERITEESVKNVDPELETEEKEIEADKKVSMGDQIKVCMKDKYWWMVIIFFFLYQFGGQMKNNALSWLSQALLGNSQITIAGTISTVGAIPTALGMVLVWPIANKIGKGKTIAFGSLIAFLMGCIGFILCIPAIQKSYGAVNAIAIASFCLKALGTAPAMYISLALMANMLDHQEAVYGIRTDGFTMAVYGSIMVCMAGVCNGIIAGFNGIDAFSLTTHPVGAVFDTSFNVVLENWSNSTRQASVTLNVILAYGVESICYLIMGIMFLFMDVEKFTKVDNETILSDQKARAEKDGVEWVEPAVRAKEEEAENARLVEESRVQALKATCDKKGLNFEEENKKFLEAKAAKEKAAAEKKAAADKAKAEKEAAKKAAYEALTADEKAKIDAKAAAKAAKEAKAEEAARKEFAQLRKDAAELRAQFSGDVAKATK